MEKDIKKKLVRNWFKILQDVICFDIEELEQNSKKFKSTEWKINYYSKRFAAKEAFSKATGFGISKNLHFKKIEIKNNKKGKPSIILRQF